MLKPQKILKGYFPIKEMKEGKELKDFLEYCSITATKTTLYKIENKLKYINDFFKGSLSSLELKDVQRFLAHLKQSNFAKSTRNDFTKIFKRFLKWKYKDWNTRFNELKDAKSISNDQRNLSKEDLLTAEEMQKIVNATDSLQLKTLLLLLQETACRPEEILKVVWKEIDFNKEEIKLYSSKTDKTRFIPINHSIEHLNRYKVECFTETPKASYKVFDISPQLLCDRIAVIEKKLNFHKHLYPYLWRHSVLSKMIKSLSPKVYEMYAGHSLETGMKIYAHLDTEDLRKELDEKIYHLEKLSPREKDEIKKLKEMVKILNQGHIQMLNFLLDTSKDKKETEQIKAIKQRLEKVSV